MISRIAKLVKRYPSRRQAAEAWGVNYSTLQNYFKRASMQPNLRRQVLEAISRCENVSVEWLLTGIGDVDTENEERKLWVYKEPIVVTTTTSVARDISRITDLLGLLKDDDLSKLAEILGLKGVEILLYLLDDDNIRLLKLDHVIKDKILGKDYPENEALAALNDANGRESGFDGEMETGEEILVSNSKRAV
ncbi:MAG: hypothetical protein ACMX3H_02935 [Sodalis sp. (in: enterobacteria)]|uniref:hypothetical protein n=1 Tax=Sodalis sp. (in: enterobacteria) TaxID=1898979 RepID=UPI0039E4964D